MEAREDAAFGALRTSQSRSRAPADFDYHIAQNECAPSRTGVLVVATEASVVSSVQQALQNVPAQLVLHACGPEEVLGTIAEVSQVGPDAPHP